MHVTKYVIIFTVESSFDIALCKDPGLPDATVSLSLNWQPSFSSSCCASYASFSFWLCPVKTIPWQVLLLCPFQTMPTKNPITSTPKLLTINNHRSKHTR